MAAITSLLKEVVGAFPANSTIKGANIEAHLTKQGVKPDELNSANLGIDPEKRYNAEELKQLEAGRQDKIETVEQPQAKYDWVSTRENVPFKTGNYREKITTFKQGDHAPVDFTTAKAEIDGAIAKAEEATAFWYPDEATSRFKTDDEANAAMEEALRVVQEYDPTADDLLGLTADSVLANWNSGSRYTSSHFPTQENYLMHSRIYDADIDGTQTRVVDEIQSDLHQQGRQRGYGGEARSLSDQERVRLAEIADDPETAEGATAEAFLRQIGIDPLDEDYPELVFEALQTGVVQSAKVPESPLQKTWLRKGIEREITDAVNEGMAQIAFPIKGPVTSDLHRSAGVQKWYETTVASTIKKVAKSIGADVEVKTMPGSGKTMSIQQHADVLAGLSGRPFGTQEQIIEEVGMEYGDDAAKVYRSVRSGRMTLEEGLKALQDGSVSEMIVVKPKRGLDPDGQEFVAAIDKQLANDQLTPEARAGLEGMKKTAEETFSSPANFKFSMYSSPIAGGFVVYQALQAGKTDEEITTYLEGKGQDPEAVQEALDVAHRIKKGVEAGLTEDEIRQHLESKVTTIQDVESIDPMEADKIINSLDPYWLPFGGKQYRTDNLPESLVRGERQEAGLAPEPSRETTFADSADQAIRDSIVDQLVKKSEGYKALLDTETVMSPGDLIAKLNIVYPNMTSVTSRTMGFAGEQTKAKATAAANEAARTHIVNAAKELGVNLEWAADASPEGSLAQAAGFDGQWLVVREDGSKAPADPGFWDSLAAEKFELGGAIAGGIAGARLSQGGFWGKGLGSVVGAAIGGASGTNFDYMSQAIQLNQNMNAEVAAHKRLTAAEASVIGDALAYPVAKGLGAGWKGIVEAKNALMGGNTERAYKSLKENLHLTDDEVTDILRQLEQVADLGDISTRARQGGRFNPDGTVEATEETVSGTFGRSEKEKGILATALTQPGGEDIVQLASVSDPSVSRAVAKSVDQRAKDLIAEAATLTDKNVGRVLKEDLLNYTTGVKQNFQRVKDEAGNSPYLENWAFDYDKLAINPVLEQMEKQIADPAVAERFMRRAEIIRSRSDGRTFADLLDLRQLVNEFRFGRGMKKAVDLKIFRDLMGKVDGAIKEGAGQVMADPKAWLADWASARSQYAQMKEVESNTLYKALTKDGVNETAVTKALTRYITSIDETWPDLMNRVPATVRNKAEGATVNILLDKYTLGTPGGDQAINFGMLSDEMSKVSFVNPEARKFKSVVDRLAKVFKNDTMLAKQHGNINLPKFQSFLTTDPTVRLQYEVASTVFNKVKAIVPSKQGRALALAEKAATLLENPLNIKSAKELLKEAGDTMNLAPKVMELQRAAALENATTPPSSRVMLYGKGPVLSLTGEGKPTKIAVTRIATADIMDEVATAQAIHRSDKKALDHALKQMGYVAKQKGSDKVEML